MWKILNRVFSIDEVMREPGSLCNVAVLLPAVARHRQPSQTVYQILSAQPSYPFLSLRRVPLIPV